MIRGRGFLICRTLGESFLGNPHVAQCPFKLQFYVAFDSPVLLDVIPLNWNP